MDPDDFEVCLCFHVNLRKLITHHRLNQPKVASQMSECFGAGTGCGFCRPFLESVFRQLQETGEASIEVAAGEYQRRRKAYHNRTGFDRKSLDSLMPPVELNPDELLDDIDEDLKLD
ncbi:(2Fe-2S)-binding protein [Candidatus Sumerlaeota bacterium]|nr:(2Fe-2S)-binding protein [Candidatus Sumerlaeota bacterium]